MNSSSISGPHQKQNKYIEISVSLVRLVLFWTHIIICTFLLGIIYNIQKW